MLINLPMELVPLMELSRKDLVNLSLVDSSHRAKFYPLVYDKVKLTWNQFKNFNELFKSKDMVRSVRVFSDHTDKKATSYGEWNISLKELLEECANLKHLTIEVVSSSRCLKYQDKFDVDLSDKIEYLKLISHSLEANDESLFELTQLQRFHNIKQLVLNGFLLTKDQFFYPKFKPDFSDLKQRSRDGRLVYLNDLKLVNCKWDHPCNLNDIFSPTYPSPNPLINMETSEFTSPERLSLYYNDQSSNFVVSERFKSFIDNDLNELFLFQTRFYYNLKHLSLVILNQKSEENKYNYYPWLNWLNLKKIFQAQNMETLEIENKSILTNLETLTLVGWRLTSLNELDKVFVVANGPQPRLKRLQLYIVKARTSSTDCTETTAADVDLLSRMKTRLELIFPKCHTTVGFVEECVSDQRYANEYTKNND
ncbi:hypothetical protein OGAPHI_002375 [Ogataea philodendri]|uniref:Uncharacterized protein n=1 Tax=Ogataea philodendri TaxID=1378263 RepID=A0A9P8PBC0_9ASCO|nr:uncharacterized protein OGAPHI_002375 [Ogataea philodendri]KAH3668621.1 hypothetical protein OGAPHI_002375 [Ogataea philodendri]